MQKQTILTVIGAGCAASDLDPLLEQARESAAHVAVMVVGVSPPLPISAYGAAPYGSIIIPENWQEDYSAASATLNQKGEDIEALLKKHGVSGDVATVFHDPVTMGDAVARRAMVCDLACVGNDLRDNKIVFDHIVRDILFGSPIGVVLNDMASTVLPGPRHVLIAWNTSLPSSRAVHAALPLLLEAGQVTIASFDPVMTEFQDGENPGSDLAKWLSHRGCTVTVQQYPSGGKEIGTCILDRATETGADMVVMGAYGHARMRQAVFGGTSRTLIEQTELPVLLAH